MLEWFRIFTATVLCLLTNCGPKPLPEPGILGLQFTGMWKEAPHMEVAHKPRLHHFLVRITGYVPPEAAEVAIFNPWGLKMAGVPLRWLDVMEVTPQRRYSFAWPVSAETYHEIRRTQSSPGPETPWNDSPEVRSSVDLRLYARLLTQDGKILTESSLDVSVSCLSCTI